MSLIDEAKEAVKKFTDYEKFYFKISYSINKESYTLQYEDKEIIVRKTNIGCFLEFNEKVAQINTKQFNIFKSHILKGIS